MFWNYNTQTSSPQIDNVFCKEDLTLQELLDQENILQELKSQNKKLIDFLIKPEVLSELVTLITTEPAEDIPEEERYKHPNLACELLTTDIPSLTENLAKDTSLLSKLYSFLEADPPLNPLLASFFSRTMGVLVARKTEQNWYSYQFTCLQVLDFLKNKESSVVLLLKHIGTSAIMDLIFKLVTQIECVEMKNIILNFMAAQGLVDNLVELMGPSFGVRVNCNAALLLCDILVRSRDAQTNSETHPVPDPILSNIESCETIKKMLEVVLGEEKRESCIIGGISLLLILLDPPKPPGDTSSVAGNCGSDGGGEGESLSPPSSPPPPVTVTTIEAILLHLPALHNLLLEPPYKAGVKMTCGVVDPPLGNTRLQVIRLLAALIATNQPQVHEQLAALNTMHVLLDLFFKYSWNNFLHTQVDKCLNKAIAVDPLPTDPVLIHNIFVKCRLLKKILDAWNENELEQNRGGCRKGYMGHLTVISMFINTRVEKSLGPYLNSHLPEDELASWKEFTDETLTKIKSEWGSCLGGKHPHQAGSDDDDKNFRNIPFQQDNQFQQLFTEYETQQMSQPFIENFGYHEGEFSEPEDSLNPEIDPISGLFNVAEEEEMERRADMFNKACSQKLQCLDEDDDEIWSDSNQGSRLWNGVEEVANYNSSDDDERPGPEGREQMDVDQGDPWLSIANASGPVANSPTNPWVGSSTEASANNEGWADFDTNFGSVPFDVNTDFPPLPEPSSCFNTSASGSRSEPLGASASQMKDGGDDAHKPGGDDAPNPGGDDAPNPGGDDAPNPGGDDAPNPGVDDAPNPGGDEAPKPGGDDSCTYDGKDSCKPENDDTVKKESNANHSSSPVEPCLIDEQQLIENFKFLSCQGLISEQSDLVLQPPESSASTNKQKESDRAAEGV